MSVVIYISFLIYWFDFPLFCFSWWVGAIVYQFYLYPFENRLAVDFCYVSLFLLHYFCPNFWISFSMYLLWSLSLFPFLLLVLWIVGIGVIYWLSLIFLRVIYNIAMNFPLGTSICPTAVFEFIVFFVYTLISVIFWL